MNRLIILVHVEGVDKILAVPKLNSGTGEATAASVVEELTDWKLIDRVIVFCYVTTACKSSQRRFCLHRAVAGEEIALLRVVPSRHRADHRQEVRMIHELFFRPRYRHRHPPEHDVCTFGPR